MKAIVLAILAAACAQTHQAQDATVGMPLDDAATHEDTNTAELLEASARHHDPNIGALLDGAVPHHDPNAAVLFSAQLAEPDPEGPKDFEPLPQLNQAFCCGKASDNGTGSKCVAIGSELINTCNSEGKTVLYCGGTFKFGKGKVTCID